LKKLLCILLLSLSWVLGAQEKESYPKVDVKVSADKVKIDGRSYYTHVVTEKQTLYSISRAYGVAVIDIIEANPKLHLVSSPLRAGDVLLIPVDKVKLPATPVTDAVIAAATEPDTTAVKAVPSPDAAPEIAVKGEPIVTVEPALAEDTEITDTVDRSRTLFTGPGPVIPKKDSVKVEFAGKRASVSLLLPFAVDTTAANRNYLNFYFGALLAVKELADQGMELEVNAIDISKSDALYQNKLAVEESDIIIGPVSSYDISRTLRILPDNRYLISPLDTRTESWTQNGRVILAATPARAQVVDVISWLEEDMRGGVDSLIVVTETGYKQTSTQTMMEEALKVIPTDRRIDVDYSLSGGLEMNEWFDVHTHLKDSLTRVVAASEHDIFVKDVIRNVYLQKNMQKNVVMYGPAKTKSSELEEMCDAFLHTSVTYYADYTSGAVVNFIMDYRALYGGEPDSYAFHGYDTMKYFLSIFAAYGEDWFSHIDEFTMSGLQMYFRFCRPAGYEGAVNAGLRRLVYSPGYKVKVTDR
jgi:LysM repeat protein